MKRILFLSVIFLLAACTAARSQKTVATPDTGKVMSEDLSKIRPTYPPQAKQTATTTATPAPVGDDTRKVNEKLDSIRVFNGSISIAEGYRILLYNGNSSEASRDVRLQAASLFPSIRTYIEWKAPSFKVKLGDFQDKLEAYYVLSELQKSFPTAIMVPDKIYLRTSE
ncbi:MAG: hypothetical protein MUF42_06625 [Cytophagaceae bacterium]|jgi:hypothetical protein|nr:hypothetical protein [Cytophagaceae bacterium]